MKRAPVIELQERGRGFMGKKGLRNLRNSGNVPVNWVKKDGSAQSAYMSEKDFVTFFKGTGYNSNAVVELKASFASGAGILKQVSFKHMTNKIEHVEFAELDKRSSVKVNIPVKTEGESEPGTVVEIALKELTVECMPTAIPESVTVDVSEMKNNDVLHISELKLPSGVKAVGEPETGVVTCFIPQEVSLEPAVEEAVAEEASADAAAEEAKPEGEEQAG